MIIWWTHFNCSFICSFAHSIVQLIVCFWKIHLQKISTDQYPARNICHTKHSQLNKRTIEHKNTDQLTSSLCRNCKITIVLCTLCPFCRFYFSFFFFLFVFCSNIKEFLKSNAKHIRIVKYCVCFKRIWVTVFLIVSSIVRSNNKKKKTFI